MRVFNQNEELSVVNSLQVENLSLSKGIGFKKFTLKVKDIKFFRLKGENEYFFLGQSDCMGFLISKLY